MPSSLAAAVRLKRVFLQRLEDRFLLDPVQIVLQRRLAVAAGGGGLFRQVLRA